tara:strand:- start:103 stop:921 length:819 start_codon:yes stop_codon:yes gene_type:complete
MPPRPPLLLPALLGLVVCALGCSSSKEPGKARSLDYAQERKQPVKKPKAEPLKPTEIHVGPQAPPRPAWRGERVRALDVDQGARKEVDDVRSRTNRDPEVSRAAARAERAHRARASVSRRRAERALAAIEREEAEERVKLRAEAAARRTPAYAQTREAAYLAAARELAGRDRHADLVPASRKIASQASSRAEACSQLHAEQLERIERSRRLTLATLARGVALPGGRLRLRHEVRRLTEVALLLDQAEAELTYARAVATRLNAEWNLALGQGQ